MSNKQAQWFGCIVLVIAGMTGLHFDVEFSGWVLFVGLIGVVST